MIPHDCPGDSCGYCQDLIDLAELDARYPAPVDPWDEP